MLQVALLFFSQDIESLFYDLGVPFLDYSLFLIEIFKLILTGKLFEAIMLLISLKLFNFIHYEFRYFI